MIAAAVIGLLFFVGFVGLLLALHGLVSLIGVERVAAWLRLSGDFDR